MENNLKDKVIRTQFIILCVSLFIFNFAFRAILFSSSSFLISFNIFVFIAAIIIIFSINKYKIDVWILLIATAVLVFIVRSYMIAGFHLGHFVVSFATLFFPLVLVSIRLNERVSVILLDYFVKIINVMMVILVIYGVFDYLVKGRLQVYIYNNSGLDTFSNLISNELSTNIYRMYSFWGHPLDNAGYFIIFIAANLIHRKYFEDNLSPLSVSVISLLGLLLSGSKFGIIIGIIMLFFFFQNTKYRTLYTVLGTTALILLFLSPMFQNNLLLRFLDAYNSNDISNGRITAYNALMNSTYNVNMFDGGGFGSSRIVTETLKVVNFEFPLLMYLFDYGIIATCLIYFVILIVPLKIFLKKKNYFIIPVFLGLFAYVNSNNGLASNGELLGQLCFITVILVSLPSHRTKEEKAEIDEEESLVMVN